MNFSSGHDSTHSPPCSMLILVVMPCPKPRSKLISNVSQQDARLAIGGAAALLSDTFSCPRLLAYLDARLGVCV